MDIQQKGSAILQTWAGLPNNSFGYPDGTDVCLSSTELGKPFGGLRKKQLLDKNLTVLALHPRADVAIEGKGWTGTTPTDMMKFNHSNISEYTPLEIADIAEKIFPSA